MINNKNKIFLLIILLVISGFLVTCTPNSCFEETTSFLKATFYKTSTGKPASPDSITLFGIGKESSRLYSKSLNLSAISLPLDPSTGNCGFVIKINDITDTLKFVYNAFPHLISKECGFTFYYSLDTTLVYGSAINSVIAKNKNITTFNEENIRIFF
jgi:hypothetical protein